MSSLPVLSPSPALEKSEDCNSKVADEMATHMGETGQGIQLVRTTTRSMTAGESSSQSVASLESNEDTTCLYCKRFFSTQRGLSIHLHYCKFKSVFSSPDFF